MADTATADSSGLRRPVCIAGDPAEIEPVSSVKFPASSEFSREFFEKLARSVVPRVENSRSINRLAANPLLKGAGNFCSEQGIFEAVAGIFANRGVSVH